jgi:hypothetical protein
VSQLPTYKAGYLVATVPLSTTITPATWLGEPLEQFLCLMGLGGLIVGAFSVRMTSVRARKERQR